MSVYVHLENLPASEALGWMLDRVLGHKLMFSSKISNYEFFFLALFHCIDSRIPKLKPLQYLSGTRQKNIHVKHTSVELFYILTIQLKYSVHT